MSSPTLSYTTSPSSSLVPSQEWQSHTRILTRLIITFDALIILSLLSLSFILFTALFSSRRKSTSKSSESSLKIHRSKAWYAFLASWILYCVSYLLILGQQTRPEPGPAFGICLVQAAAIYAAPVLAAWATFGLVMDLYLSVSTLAGNKSSESASVNGGRIRTVLSFMIPPTLASIIFVAVLAIGTSQPQTVVRSTSGMFCRLSSGLGTKIGAIVSLAAAPPSLIVEGMTFRLLKRHRNAYKNLRMHPGQEDVSLSMVIRITVFTCIPLGCLIFGALFFTSTARSADLGRAIQTANSNMTLPAASLGTALIFGTQSDLRSVWSMWIKHMFGCCKSSRQGAGKGETKTAGKGMNVQDGEEAEETEGVPPPVPPKV